ncbi:hypothetical protein, partial [Mammaliicoccus sciuri]|uniref:hypothetical protein n=1 Tax=Mammaliicoccus sciuri TaxID=1296 RepID=UPI003F56C6C1
VFLKFGVPAQTEKVENIKFIIFAINSNIFIPHIFFRIYTPFFVVKMFFFLILIIRVTISIWNSYL